jgi:hypothetical protein
MEVQRLLHFCLPICTAYEWLLESVRVIATSHEKANPITHLLYFSCSCVKCGVANTAVDFIGGSGAAFARDKLDDTRVMAVTGIAAVETPLSCICMGIAGCPSSEEESEEKRTRPPFSACFFGSGTTGGSIGESGDSENTEENGSMKVRWYYRVGWQQLRSSIFEGLGAYVKHERIPKQLTGRTTLALR